MVLVEVGEVATVLVVGRVGTRCLGEVVEGLDKTLVTLVARQY